MIFQGVPDLVRGGRSGGPWPGSSEQVSKVSLEFDFSRGFPTSFAAGVQVVRGLARRGGPRRGGQIPEPRSAPPGPTDANEPTESAAWPVAGADPEPCPGPTDAGEPTDLPGWLARQGEVRSQPTKVPRAPQAEGKLAPGSRTCPIGENTFWGTTLAGAKTFPLTLATKNSKPAEPRPRTWKFFSNRARFPNPGRPGTRGSLSPRAPSGWLAGRGLP